MKAVWFITGFLSGLVILALALLSLRYYAEHTAGGKTHMATPFPVEQNQIRTLPNFVIAPFGYLRQGHGTTPYIQRDTGLRAVLKGVKLLAVPNKMPNGGHREGKNSETDGNGGLADSNTSPATGPRVRFDIDPDLTVRDVADRLYKPNPNNDLDKGLSRSASQICDVDLYPYTSSSDYIPPGTDIYPDTNYNASAQKIPKTAAGFKQFLDDNGLTGDQGREGPYARIYPRVTTKSNIFTIHLRIQTVQIPQSYYSSGTSGVLNVTQMKADFSTPGKGDVVKVAIEYRGSAKVERFIDPNDPALATYTKDTGPSSPELNKSLDPYYRFRTVNTKRFTP